MRMESSCTSSPDPVKLRPFQEFLRITAQTFCAEVFAPQNLWKPRNRLCRRYMYRYLGDYRWANKSVGLRPISTTPKLTTTETLSTSRCRWIAAAPAHLIPWNFAHCKSFYELFQSWSFSAWVLSFYVQTNQKRGPVLVRTARRKEAEICGSLHRHAPTIWRAVICIASVCKWTGWIVRWKIKPLVPSNQIFSRSDGEKFVFKPLDFELL